MGILAERFAEKRVLSYQAIWGADLLSGRINSAAGIAVNQDVALTLTTLFACVRLLADTVSTLPVSIMERINGVARPFYPTPTWLERPSLRDPSITTIGYFSQVMMSLLLDGNSFSLVIYDDSAEALEVHVLDPRRVVISRNADSSPKYTVTKDDGTRAEFDSDDIIHIPLIRQAGALRGISPVEAARQSIGLGKVAEQYGSELFANGTAMTGIITTQADLDETEAAELSAKFDKKHSGKDNRFKTGVLTGGAEFHQLTITPEQAQFLATRLFQGIEMCRLYRVPPNMVQDMQPGSVSFASVEQQGIQFDTLTVRPYLEIIETAHRRICGGGYLHFDENGLLRGDQKSRFEANSTAINAGFMLRSGARAAEDWEPIEGLDAPLVPLNLADAKVAMLSQRAEIASRLVLVGFDPEGTLKAVGLPPIEHTGLPPRSLQQAQLLDPTDPTSLFLGDPAKPPDAGPSKKVVPPPKPAPFGATP